MNYSDQQASAIFAGERSRGWRRVSPKAVPVPPAILGFRIDRIEKFDNPWEYTVEVAHAPDYHNIPYHYTPGRYTAIDPETGLMSIYRHGALEQLPDGTWATSMDEGFGGRNFSILMQDGRRALLRGPWHGGAPARTVEVLCFDRSKSRSYFGYFLHQDLFFAIAKKFAPELQPVITMNPWGERAALGDPVPKRFTAEQETV